MWKQYLQPTKSFKAKARDPPNMRDRVQGLSQALSDLKKNVEVESYATESLGKIEKQHYHILQGQVHALKTSFTELADAFLDEIEQVKAEMREEIRHNRDELFFKIEEISKENRQYEENHHQMNSALTQSVKQAFQHLQTLKNKLESTNSEVLSLKEEIELLRNSQGITYQEKDHSEEICWLTKENERLNDLVVKTEKETTSIQHLLDKFKSKTKQFHQETKQEIQNLKDENKDILRDIKSLRNEKPPEVDTREFEWKVKEVSDNFKQSLLETKSELEKKLEKLNYLCSSFEEQLKEAPKNNVSSEKIQYIEELITTQRRELFASITAVEQNFTKKQDRITRALYSVAKQIELPEALLGFS